MGRENMSAVILFVKCITGRIRTGQAVLRKLVPIQKAVCLSIKEGVDTPSFMVISAPDDGVPP